MGMVLHAAAVSDVGLARANNEDSVLTGGRIVAVADGIAGAPAGELASEIVVRALAALDGTLDETLGAAPADTAAARAVQDGLRDAMAGANREIAEAAAADPAHRGLGTTVTALVLAGGELALLHAGDSRAYRWRDAELAQLTRDDTYVQDLLDRGVITAEEARTHPHRSVVTNAVQGEPLRLALTTVDAQPGDRLLLCTDGLTDVVTDAAIARILGSHEDRRDCADQLIRLAHEAGAPDNVTAVVADLDPAE